MTRIIVLAILVALVLPAAALAKGGQGSSGEKGRDSAVKESPSKAKGSQKADKHASRAAAKVERKAARATAQVQRKAAKRSHETSRPVEADDATGSIEPTRAVEGTRTAGPRMSRAFDRITANLEKSIAKVNAGKKSQVPPGLVRVWLKFAAWLGVDLSTMPVVPTPEPTGTIEPTTTVEPTGTIEPTTTVDPFRQ